MTVKGKDRVAVSIVPEEAICFGAAEEDNFVAICDLVDREFIDERKVDYVHRLDQLQSMLYIGIAKCLLPGVTIYRFSRPSLPTE